MPQLDLSGTRYSVARLAPAARRPVARRLAPILYRLVARPEAIDDAQFWERAAADLAEDVIAFLASCLGGCQRLAGDEWEPVTDLSPPLVLALSYGALSLGSVLGLERPRRPPPRPIARWRHLR